MDGCMCVLGFKPRLSIMSCIPSFCSGVGLVGEKVPLLLSMASSMLRSEYSSPPSSDPFRVGGGLEGFWYNERERDQQSFIRRELI